MHRFNKSLWPYLFLLFNILLVLIIFRYSFGFDKIIPSNIDWITKGDRFQHYLGWQAYRYSPWLWPHIGTIKIFTNYEPISILYFDPIPLLAIFFKAFNPILSKNFQYLGIFILSSYILNYLSGYLLLANLTKQKILSAILAWLFLLTPVWFYRTGGHEALSAHWLIIWALYLFINNSRDKNISKQNKGLYLSFSLLLLLSFYIHSYFTMMIFIIYGVLLLKKVIVTKEIVKTISYTLLSFIPLLLGAYLLGALNGFSHGVDLMSENMDILFNMNLNTWINPSGFININKTLIPGMPILPRQYEGAAYLGLGVITTLFFICIYYIYYLIKSKHIIKNALEFIRKYIYYIVLILVFMTLATSLKFVFNQHIILNIHSYIPSMIMRPLFLFRAFGRFIWPVNYLIISFTAIFLIRAFSNSKYKKAIMAICILIIMIQAIDLNNMFFGSHSFGKGYIKNDQNRKNKQVLFKQYAQGTHNLILVSPIMGNIGKHLDLGWWGIDNHMQLNMTYLSRIPHIVVNNAVQDDKDFRLGIIKKDNLYITNSLSVLEEFKANAKEGFEVYKLDQYWLVKRTS